MSDESQRVRIVREAMLTGTVNNVPYEAGIIKIIAPDGSLMFESDYYSGGLGKGSAPYRDLALNGKGVVDACVKGSNGLVKLEALRVPNEETKPEGRWGILAHFDVGCDKKSHGCICPKNAEGFFTVLKGLNANQMPTKIEIATEPSEHKILEMSRILTELDAAGVDLQPVNKDPLQTANMAVPPEKAQGQQLV